MCVSYCNEFAIFVQYYYYYYYYVQENSAVFLATRSHFGSRTNKKFMHHMRQKGKTIALRAFSTNENSQLVIFGAVL